MAIGCRDSAHALPTSQSDDPDLSFLMEMWHRLADEIKARLIELARENLPTNLED
jgi:hypothetical protein